MCENTINKMIHAIGYKGRVVGHGFRHTFSTILNDQGFNPDWVEIQIAHVDKNKIRGVYNHALYLEGRREMVQWYSDYVEQLKGS
jgi:integrase